jgi:uncharacterized iron-regulated membrane protein
MPINTGHSGLTITNWLRALHLIQDPVDYLVYRIFVCSIGLVVAMLSVTGVYIWWKKRRARKLHCERRNALSVRDVERSV